MKQHAELAFGAASLGNLYCAICDAEAEAAVDAAFEAGITLFDTAPHYGFGLSETRLGRSFAGRARETFRVSTKVGRVLEADESVDVSTIRDGFYSPVAMTERYDYSYDGINRSLEASLVRLGLERIDTVYIHDIGHVTHGNGHAQITASALGEGFDALLDFQRQGVIGEIGLGVNECQICIDVLGERPFDVLLLAGRYTLLDQSAANGVFQMASDNGIRVVLGGVYNSGILATGSAVDIAHYDYERAPAEIIDRVRAIEAICTRYGVKLPAAALQFARSNSIVSTVLVGIASAAECMETMRLWNAEIPPLFWSDLADAKIIVANAGVSHD